MDTAAGNQNVSALNGIGTYVRLEVEGSFGDLDQGFLQLNPRLV